MPPCKYAIVCVCLIYRGVIRLEGRPSTLADMKQGSLSRALLVPPALSCGEFFGHLLSRVKISTIGCFLFFFFFFCFVLFWFLFFTCFFSFSPLAGCMRPV